MLKLTQLKGQLPVDVHVSAHRVSLLHPSLVGPVHTGWSVAPKDIQKGKDWALRCYGRDKPCVIELLYL